MDTEKKGQVVQETGPKAPTVLEAMSSVRCRANGSGDVQFQEAVSVLNDFVTRATVVVIAAATINMRYRTTLAGLLSSHGFRTDRRDEVEFKSFVEAALALKKLASAEDCCLEYGRYVGQFLDDLVPKTESD